MIQQIEKLKEIINQNSMGHLPLSYRVDLMKQIGNSRTVQKCCVSAVRKPVLASQKNFVLKTCWLKSCRKLTVICTK